MPSQPRVSLEGYLWTSSDDTSLFDFDYYPLAMLDEELDLVPDRSKKFPDFVEYMAHKNV